MTEQQFAYWLNGFAELTGDTPPTAEQWKSIREHLATVFVKVTPPVNAEADRRTEDVIQTMQDKWAVQGGAGIQMVRSDGVAYC